jgi:hypothetical protein
MCDMFTFVESDITAIKYLLQCEITLTSFLPYKPTPYAQSAASLV